MLENETTTAVTEIDPWLIAEIESAFASVFHDGDDGDDGDGPPPPSGPALALALAAALDDGGPSARHPGRLDRIPHGWHCRPHRPWQRAPPQSDPST